MSAHQVTLEIVDPEQHTGEDTRAELARSLEAEVGAPDEATAAARRPGRVTSG